MKNVKLGDQVYVGVTAVRTDALEGGTVDFAPYDETFAAGRAEGYNAGKEAGLEEGFDNGKTAGIKEGIQTEYDRFWDAYQDYGNWISYELGFTGLHWNDDTFYPKYDIKATGGYGAHGIFKNSSVSNVAERLAQQGVTMDLSRAVYVDTAFQNTASVRWPEIDLSGAGTCTYLFNRAKAQTIDKLTLSEIVDLSTAFSDATSLVNITFGGTICGNINMQWSPLSAESMKSLITHLKNFSGTADAGTKTVKFSDTCWGALTADGTTAPDGNTWRDYVETSLGWLT